MKAALPVRELVAAFDRIIKELVSLSRLYGLQLLAESNRLSKLHIAELSSIYCDAALVIQDFAARHYQHKLVLMSWPRCLHPEENNTIVMGEIATERLTTVVDHLTSQTVKSLSDLRNAVQGTMMAAPAAPIIEQVLSILPSNPEMCPQIEAFEFESFVESRPHKALSGPQKVQIDPIFKPGYTMLDQKAPIFGETLIETVPYLWTTCVGETMAAELCALCAVEYDGLPVTFYRDMAKQAWDEMRHAVYYLDAAIAMLPAFEASLNKDNPLLDDLAAFRRSGRGLPIPREGNLYETIWNSTLEERLILFQIQTEAPGAARKKKNIKSVLCKTFPDLAAALEYDLRDEVSHARIGKTWLAHLCPDRMARQRLIDDTLLLRGILLLTSFAHHGGGSIETLLDRYLTASVGS